VRVLMKTYFSVKIFLIILSEGNTAQQSLLRLLTSNSTSCRRNMITMKVSKPISRVVVPSNTVLTSHVLLAALRRLPTCTIEETIEELLEVLDCRYGNPDFETDSDFELETDEESFQTVVRLAGRGEQRTATVLS
jgi:hypothetical protein